MIWVLDNIMSELNYSIIIIIEIFYILFYKWINYYLFYISLNK